MQRKEKKYSPRAQIAHLMLFGPIFTVHTLQHSPIAYFVKYNPYTLNILVSI